MTNFRKSAAIGAAAVAAVVCTFAFAQDDYESLLKALEDDTKAEKAGTAQATPVAEAPAVEATPATPVEEPQAEAKAETVAPETKPEVAEEKPAEPEAKAEVAEEKPAEPEAKPEVAEEKSEVAEEKSEVATAASAEPETKVEAAAEETPAVAEVKPTAPVEAPAAKPAGPDAELLSNASATERLRRKAFDIQARREIDEARASMKAGEYDECAAHYVNALRLLNDRADTKKFHRECEQGIAESFYRSAMLAWDVGNRDQAKEMMQKAVDMRHPKAIRQLKDWANQAELTVDAKSLADIKHRRNDSDYQELRMKNKQHLRRSRQLLAVRDLDAALDECELVLVSDPYNEEALRLRGAILKKKKYILGNEFEIARDGMIADVDRAWRPVYAPNNRELEAVSSSTVKTSLGDDPERAVEQTIIKRMKEMRLPTISFKPPATIIDAVEFFRGASRDFDRPDIPLEQRGFNFVLKTPETLRAQAQQAAAEESDDFSSNGDEQQQGGQAGVPVIPMITASDISFYEALKLVCESVDYKFKVQGPIVMVMQKNMVTDEMLTRSYPVVSAFMERMGSASSDLKEMKSAGFGGGQASNKEEGDENQERDWKEFFSLLGVQWPEGSSIMYIKTIGKLRVKNTYDNLAELEKALTEMNADPKLIEIEARFVEVEQQDLNSLGFEWILNSDYAIGGGWLNKAFGLDKNAGFTEGWTTTKSRTSVTTDGGATFTPATETKITGTGKQIWSKTDMNGNLLSDGIAGINAFGGTSDYGNGSRYLSTEGNHVSGEGKSTNDQFMRVNAFLGNADLSMILHMLSQRSDTDLLSAPKVLTRPGEEAVMKVVTEYIYPTDFDVQLQSSSSGSSGSSGSSQSAVLAVVEPQSFTMREVGVILDVTPTLTDDGNLIDLKLNTQVVDEPTWKNYGMKIPFSGNSSLQSFQGIGEIFTSLADVITSIGGTLPSDTQAYIIDSATASAVGAMDQLSSEGSKNIQYYEAPMEQPFFHVRSIDSNVSVYPGATIVMGGLITEARKAMDDKIPFLGDLPYVGRFFRSHAEQTTKRNLLIFVTTRLVDVRGREVTMNNGGTSDSDVKPAPEAKAE